MCSFNNGSKEIMYHFSLSLSLASFCYSTDFAFFSTDRLRSTCHNAMSGKDSFGSVLEKSHTPHNETRYVTRSL